MLVEEIMSRDPLYVEGSTFLTNVRQLIRDNHVRALPVVDEQKRVVGIIKSQDVLKVTSSRSNVTVTGFISDAPRVTEYANVQDAIRLMIENQSVLLPVVQAEDNPVLVGVISLMDVFFSLDLVKVPDKPISEIMSKKVVTANVDEPVTKIWDKMTSEDFTGLPVVNEKGEPVGMVTKFDILRHGWARISKEDTSKPKEATHLKVQKVMSTPLYSINPDDSVKKAIEVMLKYDMGRVTVVKDGKLAGIVDRYDLIKSYLGE